MGEAYNEKGEIVQPRPDPEPVDDVPPPATGTRFDLAEVEDPTAGLQKAEELVQYMAAKCTGEEYIAQIQGRDFPRCEWWTTVGAALGLFPQEESVQRLDRDDETVYEAEIGVYNGDQKVASGSAICSSTEDTWSGRDEYAIRSMAITRATSKAYRNGLSFLAVMADLEPTPAEEMQGEQDNGDWSPENKVGFGKHADLTWKELVEEDRDYAEWMVSENIDRASDEALDWLDRKLYPGMEHIDASTPDEQMERIGEKLSELNGWDQEKANEISEYLSENKGEIASDPELADKVEARLEERIKEAKEAVDAEQPEMEV